MKQVRCLATLLFAAGMILFSSCNSKKDKKAEENTSDTASTTDVIPATNPSGPTEIMSVKHKVADYAKWKPGYDAHDSARLANGLHSYVIARGIEDSNMVLVAMRMDDVEKAKAMGNDPGLKDVMKKAGVMGVPEINYMHAVMNDTTAITQTIRVMVKHTVKDFDAWKTEFDADKDRRMAAGITDRVVGYAIGDNHKVTLVFAVNDMDKAKEFMNSKELKDKMDKAGVTSKPEAFFYRIVAKY